MSVERFDPESQPLVEVTPAALAHFQRQLAAAEQAQALRLGVKESGCTGYRYVLDLVSEPSDGDINMPLGEGVTLLLDADSVPVLRGTRIDYVSEGLNRQLTFLNPNAGDYCGCGESFSIQAQ